MGSFQYQDPNKTRNSINVLLLNGHIRKVDDGNNFGKMNPITFEKSESQSRTVSELSVCLFFLALSRFENRN